MSLSRPATFPLLKLPWLCIKCVIQNSDVVDLIYLATISSRTRRIVQHSKYHLKEIDVHPNERCHIYRNIWIFMHHTRGNGVPLVLKRNAPSLLTSRHFNSRRGYYLRSCTAGDPLDALKTGIEFMVDLFGCKIGKVFVSHDLSTRLVIKQSLSTNAFSNINF